MKNRVSKEPGRYNAALSAEDRSKMEAGQPFYITLARDDDPTEPGTPYNKESVLPDDVAEAICPDIADPTPADALRALANRPGDIAADINNADLWEVGYFNASGNVSNSEKLRTKDYILKNTALVYCEKDYCIEIGLYRDDVWQGYWGGNGVVKNTTDYPAKLYYFNPAPLFEQGYQIKVACSKNSSKTYAPVSVDDSRNVHFLNKLHRDMFYPTPTLTFIDDDGAVEAFENWEKIGDEIGVRNTFALVTGSMEKDVNAADLWEIGSIGYNTGTNRNGIVGKGRTIDYIPSNVKRVETTHEKNWYQVAVLAYNADGTFVGVYNGSDFVPNENNTTDNAANWYYAIDLPADKDYKYRVLVREADGSRLDEEGKLASVVSYVSLHASSWEDVERLQNKGFEFVSHTHGHIDLNTETADSVSQDFKSTIATLREHGCESRYVVYPYDHIGSHESLVKKYFLAGINGMPFGQDETRAHHNPLPIDTYFIRRFSVLDIVSGNNNTVVGKDEDGNDVTHTNVYKYRTLEYLQNLVNNAIANGSWLILCTHLRDDNNGFYCDADSRELIVNLCKYAAEKGMAIQTFGEAFQRYKNITEKVSTVGRNRYILTGVGDYVVDCNGIVHTKE